MTDLEPRILPVGWRRLDRRADGARYLRDLTGQTVIISREDHDGRWWRHVSTAFRDRMPTWDELKAVKDWAIGPDKFAYQVIPPPDRYVNIHPYCLHLWSLLDDKRGQALPEFSKGSGML